MTLKKAVAPVCLLVVLALIVLVSPTIVRGFIPEQQIGTWAAGPSLSSVRTSATATVMYDGRVLIAGGKDDSGEPVTNVEIVGTNGAITAAAPMNIARSEHAAVWLYDGYVLVTGGTTRGGGVTNTAEMYDPLHDTWSLLAAVMVDPRSGHTATNLADGRVLIAGGDNGTNALSSIETFSIVTEQFSFAGAMRNARQELAAASIRNGNVLLIGGEDNNGAAVASSEVFNPETNLLTAGPELSIARAAATATPLLDGSVLVAGGRNAEGDLASLEVIDVTAASAQVLPVAMATPRSKHSALRLGNNNQVLIVGGMSAGVALNSAVLYTPWTGELKPVASMLSVRPDAVLANLASPGRAIVAGGNTNSTEIFGFATISTDAVEYIPGQRVLVSGTGWQPGEQVTVSFHRTDNAIPDKTFGVAASAFGTISLDEFVLQASDEFSHYTVTATGAVSQAQTQFDDAVALTSISVQSNPPGNLAGNSFQFGLRLITTGNGNNTISGNMTLVTPPTGVTLTGGSAYSIQGANTLNQTVTVGTTSALAAGQYTLTFGNSTNALTTTGTLTINQAPIFGTQPANQSVVYPQNATFSAAATGYPAVSYQWYLSTDHGSSWTPVSGATSASYTVVAPQPSVSGNQYRVIASNVVGYTASNSATLTVGKGAQSINFAALTGKTFGDPSFSVSATATSGLPVSFTASGNCSITGATVTATGAGSCTITASQSGDSNYSAAPQVPQTFSIGKANATVTLGALEFTYSGLPITPTATTLPAGLPVTWTGAPQTNVGTYPVTATINDPNYQGAASGTLTIGKTNQTISFSALSDKTFGDAPFGVSATSTSDLPVLFSVGSSDSCTIAGSTVTVTGAGPCTVTANQSGNANYNPAPAVARTFSVAKANAGVSLSNMAQTYTGSALTPSVSTSPSGLAVTWTGAPQTNAGSYAVTATVNDANHVGSANGTFIINKADQVINFDALAPKVYGDASFTVSASATSGLAVTFTASGNCSINAGATVNISGAGSCIVTASQPGDSNYNPAIPTTQTFSIAKALATVTLSGLNPTYTGSGLTPIATTSPAGLSVAWTNAPQTNVGTYSVTATVSDANYQGSATGSFVISKATQTIGFAALADKQYGDSPFTLSATSTSGLPVSFSVGLSDNCAVTGSTVTITGAGSCTVTASQIGDTEYQAANSISNTFAIAKMGASINLGNLNFVYDGSPKAANPTTTPLGLPFTITYGGYAAAPTTAGDYAVIATITDANHSGSASATMTIAKADQIITFSSLSDKNVGGAPFTVSATASSGLAISFTASGNCSVSGSTVTIGDIGSCTLNASQSGDANYKAAPLVQQTFAIVGGTPVIAWPTPAPIVFGTAITGVQLNAAATYGGNPLAGTYAYSPAAGYIAGSGTHLLSVTFTPSDSAYNTVSSTVQLDVSPATVSVNAPSASRAYGDTNPTFAPQYVGFLGSDSATTAASCVTSATSASHVGPYTITCGGAAATNYQFTYTPGVLTISPVTLTVTPANVSRPQGQANPTLTGTISGIRNSDAISASYSTTATTASPVGTYPITATLSDGGTDALSNYAQVVNSGTLTVTNNKPDLIEAVTMLTSNPAAGTSIQVSDSVTNIGASSANASMTRIYLSNNGTTKLAGLGTHDVPPVASSTSYGPITTTVTLPTNYVGTYYVLACADDVSSVVEANETNNCAASSSFTVQAADLVVSSVTAPGTAVAGSSMSVVDTIRNQGLASANASVTRFYLSTNGTTKVAALGTRDVPVIAAGASSGPVTSTVAIPSNYVGTYYLIACADDVSSVVESNEANNCTSSSAFVVQGADLVVGSVSTASTPIAGGSILVTDVTTNRGVAPANASMTRYYLSNNGTAKSVILSSRYVLPLAANASDGPATTTVTLPVNIAGTYYLMACADDVSSVQESNESNNCTASAPIVVQGADLIVTVTAPSSVTPGSSFAVTDTTSNQGQGPANASTTRFYLSSTGTNQLTSLGGRSINGLSSGASSGPATSNLTMPAKLNGKYYVLACVDDTSSVVESVESNNCASSGPITVK